MNDFDTSCFDLEQASGGRNKIILDDLGNPSVMVAVPAFKVSDVIDSGADEWHPAFIVDDKLIPVIWVSKYQNIVVNDRAYSLAGKTPATNINFDKAVEVCRNKGVGWHLMSNAEWSSVALLSKANNTQPYGNNNYGFDKDKPWIHGIPATYGSDGRVNLIKTGSIGALSSHDHTDSGVMDLNGNVWEWCGAARLNDGEINIIPNNNAAKHNCDMSANSSEWKAIMPDGQLVAPGTIGTLKYKKNIISTDVGEAGDFDFDAITAASDITIPNILKVLTLAPDGTGYKNDHVWINNEDERFLLRSGSYTDNIKAGVFALHFLHNRFRVDAVVGFRSCYYDPESLIEIT